MDQDLLPLSLQWCHFNLYTNSNNICGVYKINTSEKTLSILTQFNTQSWGEILKSVAPYKRPGPFKRPVTT